MQEGLPALWNEIASLENLANPSQIKSANDNIGTFSTENEDIQMFVEPYGKRKPYENSNHTTALPEILTIVKTKKYTKPGTDAVTINSNDHQIIYIIDHSRDEELQQNLIDGDGFGIRNTYKIEDLNGKNG